MVIPRLLQTPNPLLARVIGAGKTFTRVATATELKWLGRARKPRRAVSTHLQKAGQFSTAGQLGSGRRIFSHKRRPQPRSRVAEVRAVSGRVDVD